MLRRLSAGFSMLRVRSLARPVRILLLGLCGGAALAFAFWLMFGTRTLTIAVGPAGSTDHRVMVAFLQILQRERAPLRLKLVMTDGPAESARIFDRMKTDLAVVRSDIGVPERSATIAILRRNVVSFATRPGAGIRTIADLRDKSVGLIAPRAGNEAVLAQVLAHYGLTLADIRLVGGTAAEIVQAAQDGKLDAVYGLAPVSDRFMMSVLRAFPAEAGKEAGLIGLPAAEAIAQTSPAFDTFEIAQGAFLADPQIPEEATPTLSVAHHLVARRTLDEGVVSEFVKLLSALRLALVAATPAANSVELPETEDRGARIPVHAGAIAYIEGETKTFFERYGDWIYLAIMGASILGSIATAFYARVSGKRPPIDVDSDLESLAGLIEAARAATEVSTLDQITVKADQLHAELVQAIATDQPDADRIAAIRFLVDEFRDMQVRRRAALAQSG